MISHLSSFPFELMREGKEGRKGGRKTKFDKFCIQNLSFLPSFVMMSNIEQVVIIKQSLHLHLSCHGRNVNE